MKKPLILFLSIVLSAASITAWSGKDDPDPNPKDEPKPVFIDGVEIQKTLTVDGTELKLQGAGPRVHGPFGVGFHVYVMQIYMQFLCTDTNIEERARAIIENEDKMAVTLTLTHRWATSEELQKALNKGFEKSPKKDDLKNEIDQLKNAFNEETSLFDKFSIHYIPEEGTKVYKNKEPEALATISTQQQDFKKALCRIWLGKKPVDTYLKGYLLNNSYPTTTNK